MEEVQEMPVRLEKKKTITYADMHGIDEVLMQARVSMKNAKGDMVYAITKNLEISGKYMRDFEKRRREAIEMFAEKDEEGKVKNAEQTEEEKAQGRPPKAAFAKGQEARCREYLTEILKEEIEMEKPFRTIPYNSFKNAEIDMKVFRRIDFFIETFVTE